MTEYDKEKWVELYQTAMLELEHAKMAGRIGDARTELAARIEKLHGIPGLHSQERQAIEDALSGLRMLEGEEERRAVTVSECFQCKVLVNRLRGKATFRQ